MRIQILTTLPKSWTLTTIKTEFGVSNFPARKAKKLLHEKGSMSPPDPKPGRTLDPATVAFIKDFYQNDEVTRQMPGKNDFCFGEKIWQTCTCAKVFNSKYIKRRICTIQGALPRSENWKMCIRDRYLCFS